MRINGTVKRPYEWRKSFSKCLEEIKRNFFETPTRDGLVDPFAPESQVANDLELPKIFGDE